jgi:uncharacterized protein
MKCRKFQTHLRTSDRQAIEIDFCPQCRGVWLDRGELDKLIERASRYVDDTRCTRRHDTSAKTPTREREQERGSVKWYVTFALAS